MLIDRGICSNIVHWNVPLMSLGILRERGQEGLQVKSSERYVTTGSQSWLPVFLPSVPGFLFQPSCQSREVASKSLSFGQCHLPISQPASLWCS
jgi:hypothetical protein